jgi:hypothetical protein
MNASILSFENKEALTPFAPIFKYHIFECEILELDYIKYLEEYILSVEQEIIKNTLPTGDGMLIGLDSLTSRLDSINFFKCHEFDYLRLHIKNSIQWFTEFLNIQNFNEDIYGQCWANVMRTGEQLTTHKHATSFNNHRSFLSGHVCVRTKDSHTYYCNAYDRSSVYNSKNKIGKMTLFPSWIEHGTSTVEDDIRITIAFDLQTEHCYNLNVSDKFFNHDNQHWIKI